MDEQYLLTLIERLEISIQESVAQLQGDQRSSMATLERAVRDLKDNFQKGNIDFNQAQEEVSNLGQKAKQTDKDFSTAGKGANTLSRELRGTGDKARDAGAKVAGALNSTGEDLGFFRELLTGVSGKLILFSGALVGTVAALDQTLKNFRELSEVGQTFSGGMLDMYRTAFESQMTLDQFSQAVKNSSGAVSALGLRRFGELSAETRELAQQFGSFGMTTDQLNQYMGDYIEIQRAAGTLDQMRRNMMASEVNSFIKNVDSAAAATGKLRSEILSNTKEQLLDPMNNLLMRQLPKDLRDSFKELTTLGGAQLGSEFTDIMRASFSDLGIMSSEAAQALAGAGGAGTRMLEIMRQMSEDVKAGENPTAAFYDMVEQIQAEGGDMAGMVQNLRNQGFEEFATMLQRVTEINAQEGREAEKRRKRLAPFMNLLANFQAKFQEITGAVGNLFVAFAEGLLPKVDETSKTMGEWIDSFVGWLQDLQPAFKAAGKWVRELSMALFIAIGWMKDFYGILSDVYSWVKDNILGPMGVLSVISFIGDRFSLLGDQLDEHKAKIGAFVGTVGAAILIFKAGTSAFKAVTGTIKGLKNVAGNLVGSFKDNITLVRNFGSRFTGSVEVPR